MTFVVLINLTFAGVGVRAQSNSQVEKTLIPKSDSVHLTKYLPLLKSEACITKLLTAVVNSQSQHFNTRSAFYALFFSNKKHHRYLKIFVDFWQDAKDTTYLAEIQLRNSTFLCGGDVLTDSLFHRSGLVNKRVYLKAARRTADIAFNIEPSLQGFFPSCGGLPLYVEIYTTHSIRGYKMKVTEHGNRVDIYPQ